MQTLTDLYHYIGGDLGASATGDLQTVDGTKRGEQRVLRRLLTNPVEYDAAGNVIAQPDYPFHPTYGAGLPRHVGRVADIPKIRALILGQMLLEDAVAQTPAPTVSVKPIQNGITGGIAVRITYTDAQSKQPVMLNFSVNK